MDRKGRRNGSAKAKDFWFHGVLYLDNYTYPKASCAKAKGNHIVPNGRYGEGGTTYGGLYDSYG